MKQGSGQGLGQQQQKQQQQQLQQARQDIITQGQGLQHGHHHHTPLAGQHQQGQHQNNLQEYMPMLQQQQQQQVRQLATRGVEDHPPALLPNSLQSNHRQGQHQLQHQHQHQQPRHHQRVGNVSNIHGQIGVSGQDMDYPKALQGRRQDGYGNTTSNVSVIGNAYMRRGSRGFALDVGKRQGQGQAVMEPGLGQG
ncbi:unnamed protein product, partial [Discosporangium mesarthrocarpum]